MIHEALLHIGLLIGLRIFTAVIIAEVISLPMQLVLDLVHQHHQGYRGGMRTSPYPADGGLFNLNFIRRIVLRRTGPATVSQARESRPAERKDVPLESP